MTKKLVDETATQRICCGDSLGTEKQGGDHLEVNKMQIVRQCFATKTAKDLLKRYCPGILLERLVGICYSAERNVQNMQILNSVKPYRPLESKL